MPKNMTSNLLSGWAEKVLMKMAALVLISQTSEALSHRPRRNMK